MKRTLILVLTALSGGVLFAAGAQESASFRSLRGEVPLQQEAKAAPMKKSQRDHAPDPRDYVQQPPLIPHTIRDYRITARHNKCMECHSWRAYREFGATKVSTSHFKDRSGMDTANISPLRYFCTQCHVPQMDAKPLVENTFKAIEAIRQTE